MASYLITYDLIKTKDYAKLYEAIRSYPKWCHLLDSNWVVISNKSAANIRDHLTGHIDGDDKLFVSKLPDTADAAWKDLPTEISEWLLENL